MPFVIISIGLFLVFFLTFMWRNEKRWIVSSEANILKLFEKTMGEQIVNLDGAEKFYFESSTKSSVSTIKLFFKQRETLYFIGDLFQSDIKNLYHFLKTYSNNNSSLKEIEDPLRLMSGWVVGILLSAPLFTLLYLTIKEILF
ncbi:hypothetical protein [Leptospira santarosai]|uniref:hypothetical protein n=1 Tax=Leptospira santarosai TaxID=28183 RepID=UPI0007733AD5|nr:hypothetical protein [Leptospira santarosai]